MAVDWAPDGRAFIAEKPGRLKVVAPGAETATLLLDISDRVNSNGDRGLEGVAVDAAFATNGFVYLAYVYELDPMVADSDGPMVSRVTRIRVLPDGTLENPSDPETVILGTYDEGPCPPAANNLDCMPADSTAHMIGTVRADPDGTLWVGHGDGASFGSVDPRALRALDEQSLAGKILHVDRNGQGLPGHPFCPANANLSDACTKVYAKGFRNPYRFHFRPSGGLSAGDVGWNTREEIDLPSPGKSYGWPCYEGTMRTPGYEDLAQCEPFYEREGTPQAEQPPVYDYGRNDGGSVIGGPTYTAEGYPDAYKGSIFFGDYVTYTLRRLSFDAGGAPVVSTFATDWIGTDLEIGPGGDLHVVDFGTGAPGDGSLRRVVFTPGDASPVAVAGATPRSGDPPLTVQFDGSGSSDPDGGALTYDWDFGDGSPHSSSPNPSHTYTSVGSFTARLRVTDPGGLTGSATVPITSGRPPEATIEAPAPGSLYRDGDTIQLRGSATDEGSPLPASALSWSVKLRHLEHDHSVQDFTGVAEASFQAARDHDADSHYVITLRATDASGLTSSRTVTIRPQAVTARLDSLPPGAPVSYGGRSAAAPYSQPTAIGYDTTVSAAGRFISGGRPFYFDRWSDGGARIHDVRVPAGDLTLLATYVEDTAAGGATTASSTQSPEYDPARAVDGDPATRWSSTFRDGEHWQVDLGSVRTIDRVELDWESAYPSRYRILTSRGGERFGQAAEQEIASPGEHTTAFAARNARYVRIQSVTRATPWGISLREARVLGPADDAALGPADPSPPPAAPSPQGPRPDPRDGYTRTVLATGGLIALYGLGEPGGAVMEARGRRDGRYLGRPRRVESLIAALGDGGARIFDGRDDGADLNPNRVGTPRRISVEAWVKPGRAGREQYVVTDARRPGADGFALLLDRAGRPRMTVGTRRGTATAVGAPRLGPGRTRHLVGTFDGRRVRLWVDGVLRGSRRAPGAIAWRRGRDLRLAGPPGRGRRFRGGLDEVALYRRALGPAQVRSHFRARR